MTVTREPQLITDLVAILLRHARPVVRLNSGETTLVLEETLMDLPPRAGRLGRRIRLTSLERNIVTWFGRSSPANLLVVIDGHFYGLRLDRADDLLLLLAHHTTFFPWQLTTIDCLAMLHRNFPEDLFFADRKALHKDHKR